MGSRGPIPKRVGDRLGHLTRAEKNAVTAVDVSGPVEIPPADDAWHPIALAWYNSLAESGQRKHMEPSDWAAAQYVAEVMTKNLTAAKFSAQLFGAIWTAMGDLLTTEGERRRVKMEINRKPAKPDGEAAKVTRLDDYRDL